MFLRVKQLRVKAGLNQAEVAEILGCAQSSYANQEDGRRDFSLRAVIGLSLLYQVSIDYLLGLTDEKIQCLSPYFCLSVWEKKKPYCERIRSLRKENGLTQEQAAIGVGRSQQSYSTYEKDEKVMTTRVLVKLARFYQVSADYILGLTDER